MKPLADHAVDLATQPGTAKVQFGSWTAAVRQSVMSFRFDCDRPQAFSGLIRNRSLGNVNFVDMACEKHAAHRDWSTISESDAGFYVLTLQLAGQLRVTQDERSALLKPGMFSIYDSSRPAAVTASDDYKSTCIRFPKEQLGSRSTDPLAGHTATTFEYTPGLTSAVWDMVLTLNRNLESLGPHGPLAVRNTLDLVRAMLRTELGGHTGLTAEYRKETLLQRIREYVDLHLGDPTLGPARIAAAHYVSLRHLHHLFEQTDQSVARWIRARRVEMSRRDLSDPGMAHVTASAIAAQWGFTSASHFGQVFKSETGHTPAEYRRQALTGAENGLGEQVAAHTCGDGRPLGTLLSVDSHECRV